MAVKSKRRCKRKKATSYARGADFERTVKKDLEGRGFFVIRSAGSKSPVDLIAIRAGQFYLIQCASRRKDILAKLKDVRKTVADLGKPMIMVWREKVDGCYANQYMEVTQTMTRDRSITFSSSYCDGY